METPTKKVYENFCRVCCSIKATSKLSVFILKSGWKTEIGEKLEKYCRIYINDSASRHICTCCKNKLENVVCKVDEIRSQWRENEETSRRKNSELKEKVRVKRMLSLDDNSRRESAVRARLEINFAEQVSV